CDDVFISRLAWHKEGIKYIFQQDLFREADEQICFRATVELVCLINGRLGNSDVLEKALQ
ncbi:MAG: acyl-CoA thioesterase, partial [Prevotella sp.]|nr:acyl-CoA thioesterase [Prevotella sp.]